MVELNYKMNYWLVTFVVIAAFFGLVIGDDEYSEILLANNSTTECKF